MTKQDVLKNCTVEGNNVKLPEGQLEREVYLEVKKSLELIGGKWKGGKTAAFVFEESPAALLEQLAEGEQRNLKKEHQYFATPENLALQMASKLAGSVKPGALILEPSAGDGALVKALHKYFTSNAPVDCYELMELNRTKLQKVKGATVLGNDFLKQCRVKEHYDVIIANPPFTNSLDILHFAKMYEVLKPGGVMITLTSNSWTFGSKPVQVAFKSWLHILKAEIEEVPAGSFFESGTQVGAQMITVYKAMAEAPEIPASIAKKLAEACKDDGIKPTPATPEPLSQTDVFGFLRKYNGYAFFDGGKYSNGMMQLLIHPEQVTDPRGIEATHTIYYEYTGPDTINKKIWEARAWVDKQKRCRVCKCTEHNCETCFKKTGVPCTWAEDDLCSACVGADEKDAAKPLQEIEEAEIMEGKTGDTVEVEQSVYFFQKLAGLDTVDMYIRVFKKNGKLTLMVKPGVADATIMPVTYTGTGEEADNDFFSRMLVATKKIETALTNVDDAVKAAEESASGNEPVKAPAKKAAEKKKADPKPAAKVAAKPKKPGQPPMFEE